MFILLEISEQIVALINECDSQCSVAQQYNLVHGTKNQIYRRYLCGDGIICM